MNEQHAHSSARATANFGRTDLPDEQREALRKALFWEWFTIVHTVVTVSVISLVVAGSQAMKTAWIEDMLSVVPQVAFLVALLLVRRRPSERFPFGLHRSMGIGHLVAGLALLAVGAQLAFESVSSLFASEHEPLGEVTVFGIELWRGWLMIGAMLLFMIGPFVYGPAKAKLAPVLHNKVLRADADMAKADWTSTAASVVGVAGIGMGWWWLDGAAALFISIGIVRDGFGNVRAAVLDLIDQRARTVDDKGVNPLIARAADCAQSADWVREAAVRMRDMGQVFHAEVFVIPRSATVTLEQLDDLRTQIVELDWRMQDVALIPVQELPAGL